MLKELVKLIKDINRCYKILVKMGDRKSAKEIIYSCATLGVMGYEDSEEAIKSVARKKGVLL